MNQFPSFDLVFEGVDEVLLSKRLIFGEIDLLNQIPLLNHFASDDLIAFGIDGHVGLGETTLTQLLVLDGVASIHYF
jgi:hypothetical protein